MVVQDSKRIRTIPDREGGRKGERQRQRKRNVIIKKNSPDLKSDYLMCVFP